MGGPQFAGQLTDVAQIAHAVANAQQADVGSVAWDLDQPGQFNIVRSDAAAWRSTERSARTRSSCSPQGTRDPRGSSGAASK